MKTNSGVQKFAELDSTWLWLGILAAVLASFFVVFGATGYGFWHVDANYLTLPAVAWASGQGFVNPIWPSAETLDPQGIGRFLYHGPAFQILLRAFLRPATAAQALVVIQWINALNIMLFAWFLWRAARTDRVGAVWVGRIAQAMALFSFAAILMAAIGRPETLAVLLVLVGAHLLLSETSSTPLRFSRSVFVGAILGLLFVTHPVNGVEVGLLLSAWCAFRQPARMALLHVATAGATAASVAVAFLAILFPFPVVDWITGMRAQMAATATIVDLRILRFFVRDVRYPAYGLTLLLGVVVCLIWWWRNRRDTASPWVAGVSAMLFLVVVGRVMLLIAFRAYDSYPLFALLAAALMVAAGRVRRPSVRIGLLIALALPGIGFARAVLLFPSYLSTGMSLMEARGAFQEVLEEMSGPVGITRTLWVLTEDYERLRVNFSLDNIDERTGEPLDVVVVEQYRYASVDSLPGYRLVRSYSREGHPKFAGVPLAWSTPGYQFDVYQRETVVPTSNPGGSTGARNAGGGRTLVPLSYPW